MVDVKQVHQKSMASFQAAFADENAAYQRAAATGDVEEMSRAANVMAGLRATMRELNNMANEVMNPQPAAVPVNGRGLTAAEAEAAKFSGITEEEYAKQKQKLWAMRARGEYPMPGQG
jgi:hypothetical protein